MKRALVTGAGGFIGGHLVKYLKARGYWVRGVDLKRPEFDDSAADEFVLADLRSLEATFGIFEWRFDEVYALAADMGGMGFISQKDKQSEILRNNLQINLNTAQIAAEAQVGRYFFSSSACIYPDYRQKTTDVVPLSESMAYPAQPQDSYGWEKLITERLLLAMHDEGKLNVRIARFHNCYGPLGTWQGGREKAPAALCRKVAYAKWGQAHNYADDATGRRLPVVEVWGDGEATRSYMYIDDCVEGIYRLMQSEHTDPLNIGSADMVSVNVLLDVISDVAACPVVKRYVNGPTGVRGRNSDNTRCKQVLGWEPTTLLRDGIETTYDWIEAQVLQTIEVKS